MSSRKRIVFAINNLGIGGAENMLIEQVRYLNKECFVPIVVTLFPNPEVNISADVPEGVEYKKFNFSSIFDLIGMYELWSYYRREKIYAVVTNLFDTNLAGRVAAILARVPIILSYEHNIYKQKKRWQIAVDKFLSLFTKKILVGSKEVLEFTLRQGDYDKSKLQLNYNSIPLKLGKVKAHRSEVLHKYGLPEECLYIVTAGSLTEQKGHKYLISAADKMRNDGLNGFKILIFGRGSLENSLLEQIDSLDLNKEVKLMGIGKIEEILAISDIFTLPSLWEGLSIALLQSMDAKCPIVATRVSGTNEALEDGVSGLIVQPGEVSELAHALEILVKNKEMRVNLAEKASERVKMFSIEKNVRLIENLILQEQH